MKKSNIILAIVIVLIIISVCIWYIVTKLNKSNKENSELENRIESLENSEVIENASKQKDYNVCIEIASIISNNDSRVIAEVTKCTNNPVMYFQENKDKYEERGIVSSDSIDIIIWIGMVECLENNNYVCECDYKEELEDFIYSINELKTAKDMNIQITEEWCDYESNGEIPEWCSYINNRLSIQKLVVATIDIDSDSYVMFICKNNMMSKMKELAQNINHRIDLATEV